MLAAPPARLDKMKKASLEAVAHHSMGHTLDVFEALYRGDPVTDLVADPTSSRRADPLLHPMRVRGGSSAG